MARDLLHEARASVDSQPGRALFTSLGTVIGVGSLIMILAIASSAKARISSRFDALLATEVVVTAIDDESSSGSGYRFPTNADERLEALNGVKAAGEFWTVAEMQVTRFAESPADAGVVVPVHAATRGALDAIHARYNQGGVGFNRFHDRNAQRVVVVGESLAKRLDLALTDQQTAVYLDGVPFTVTGIVEDTDRERGVQLGLVIPVQAADEIWGVTNGDRRVIIETEAGAAQVVARDAPLALRPENVDGLSVAAPPNPETLRGQIEADTNSLLVLLAIVSLIGGAITIANTTLVSVLERVHEIGLRRALGARRRHIACQFLAESAVLGLLGGVVGTGGGILGAVVVTASRGWTTVIDPVVPLAGPAIGLACGVLAGLYPAIRATHIEPVTALRR